MRIVAKEVDRILRMQDVVMLTGLSKSTIYRMIKEGEFPKSTPLGCKSVGWLSSTVEAWISERFKEEE